MAVIRDDNDHDGSHKGWERNDPVILISGPYTKKHPTHKKVCHHTLAEHVIYLMFDQKSIAPTLTKEVPTQRLIVRQMSKDVSQPPSSEFSKI